MCIFYVILSERNFESAKTFREKLSHPFDICVAYQLSPVATHIKVTSAIKAAVTAASASHLLHQ